MSCQATGATTCCTNWSWAEPTRAYPLLAELRPAYWPCATKALADAPG